MNLLYNKIRHNVIYNLEAIMLKADKILLMNILIRNFSV